MARGWGAAIVAGALTLLVVLVGGLHWLRPYADAKRPVLTATPSPGPIVNRETVTLKPGGTLCQTLIPYATDAAVVQVRLNAARGPVPPVRVVATAPGYRATGRLAGYPAGQDAVVSSRITPPQRAVTGRTCFVNEGRRPVDFVSNRDARSLAWSVMVVDGQEFRDEDVELNLYAAQPASMSDRRSAIVGHVSSLAGGLAPRWLLDLLLVLVVVGIPVGVAVAIASGFRPALSRDGREPS